MFSVILVKPQMGENIGAAARVMLNFGVTDLRLVAPRDGWPNQKAIDMASGAIEKMNLQVFETFEQAIADLDYLYATTARRRDLDKEVITPREIKLTGKTGIIFGPERTGMENAELSYANKIVEIPVNPAFPSVNLAQSVAILMYELASRANDIKPVEGEELATKSDLSGLFQHFDEELSLRNFFQVPEKKPGMMINIRTMLSRANLTGQEVRTLRGIIRSLSRHDNV